MTTLFKILKILFEPKSDATMKHQMAARGTTTKEIPQ